ncbi:MAG: dephospho-CoA kinase [Terriglobia bacterium]
MLKCPLLPSCFGLTGGIASGKSTVASYLCALGAKLIDADEIGHELLCQHGAAFDEVVECFGKKILNASGEIDRKLLGGVVFSNPRKRMELEAVLHPRIIQRQEELAAQYHHEDAEAVIMVEAALIYEAGVQNRFRKIVVAWCSPKQQIERLISKSTISREAAANRIGAQMPAEEKRRRADFVIDCSRSLASTEAQVRAVYPQLRRLLISA